MSPYCSDCGAQVRQMDSYCWQCGSELEFGDKASASTRQRDRSGASDRQEETGDGDEGETAFSFGDTGESEETSSRDGVAETEGYVGGDGEDRDGDDVERDIYGSGGDDRHSYGEEDESRHYAEEPEPRSPDEPASGNDSGEEHEQRSSPEADSLDSEIQRIDETPGSQQEVERSEPPWKETDSSDLEASGSVSEDRPRYVRQNSGGGRETSAGASPGTASGSTAAVKLGVSLTVLGAVAAAIAHDQVAGVTAFAPVVEDALPSALTEDTATMVTARTAGVAMAAAGAVVAVVGRYRS